MGPTGLRQMVGEVLAEVADAVEGAAVAPAVRVGVTAIGSERGPEEVIRGAELAAGLDRSLEVVVIGSKADTTLPTIAVEDEEAGHAALEVALEAGRLDAAVTLHYPFPMGVATVGRVVTPGRGKEMLIASCTGAADTDRVVAMVKNVLLGRAVAATLGWEDPSVGLCTVDGARQVERAVRALAAGGYPVRLAESIRVDGGPLLRGNDCLWGTPDVLVCDTLTGNLLVKFFSAYTTGGSYEAFGFGYGPGVGEGFGRIIGIISRASGAAVIASAVAYVAQMVRARLPERVAGEFQAARAAGLESVLGDIKRPSVEEAEEPFTPPAPKAVSEQIGGVDVLEIEEAVRCLARAGIYASSGMGCSGPVIMVALEDVTAAVEQLINARFLPHEGPAVC
jgi:hypothetical protein